MTINNDDWRRDIADFVIQQRRQRRFKYWLCLRSGNAEWNAGAVVPINILLTLEHGKSYSLDELGIHGQWQITSIKMPNKVQFIVEKL